MSAKPVVWRGVVWCAPKFFWLASHSALAGAVARHEPAGHWWAAVPCAQWPQDDAARALLLAKWNNKVGNARQELVRIGIGIGMDMDEAQLRKRFDACLLTDEELQAGPSVWRTWTNHFPGWP